MESLALVKYKGSRKLLETLIKFPRRSFTINELSKKSNVPFASAWRLVKLWGPAGLIETGRVGRCVTVKLRKTPYLRSIMHLLSISSSPQAFTANKLISFFAKEKKVEEAYLFGSVAKGTEKLGSDIDIALLADEDFDQSKLIYDVYNKYGTKVVPLVFKTSKELEAFMVNKEKVRLK